MFCRNFKASIKKVEIQKMAPRCFFFKFPVVNKNKIAEHTYVRVRFQEWSPLRH